MLLLLGDLGMETERFESAMTDYEQALGVLKQNLQVSSNTDMMVLLQQLPKTSPIRTFPICRNTVGGTSPTMQGMCRTVSAEGSPPFLQMSRNIQLHLEFSLAFWVQ